MKRAVVVAHPDDETLWFGGIVVAEPGDWTIVCCSIPRTDPVRAWKFFTACDLLGARGWLLPFGEPAAGADLMGLDTVDLGGFAEIVTHNAEGEYGHRHHRQVHAYVTARASGRTLVGGYGSRRAADRSIALTPGQMERKMEALRAYDHVSSSDDGRPKWQALIARYGTQFNLGVETYARA